MEGRIFPLEIQPEASVLEDQYVFKHIHGGGGGGGGGWESCKSRNRKGLAKEIEGRGIKGCITVYLKKRREGLTCIPFCIWGGYGSRIKGPKGRRMARFWTRWGDHELCITIQWICMI